MELKEIEKEEIIILDEAEQKGMSCLSHQNYYNKLLKGGKNGTKINSQK